MAVIQAFNDNVPQAYIVPRCSPKQGCTVDLREVQPEERVIVDCDKFIAHRNPGHNMCDYIIACELENDSISVIEMKSRGVRASEVREQLQQGARLAEQWVGNARVNKFVPILLSKGGGKELRVLAKQKINFQGSEHSESIRTRRCGEQLRRLL